MGGEKGELEAVEEEEEMKDALKEMDKEINDKGDGSKASLSLKSVASKASLLNVTSKQMTPAGERSSDKPKLTLKNAASAVSLMSNMSKASQNSRRSSKSAFMRAAMAKKAEADGGDKKIDKIAE